MKWIDRRGTHVPKPTGLPRSSEGAEDKMEELVTALRHLLVAACFHTNPLATSADEWNKCILELVEKYRHENLPGDQSCIK